MGLIDLTIYHYPIFRRKLFLSKNTYFLRRDQSKGERDLTEIAEKAKIEDHWTYFNDTNYWFHFDSPHHEEFLEDGRVIMNKTPLLMDKSETAEVLGEDITEYHIHPDCVVEHIVAAKNEKRVNKLFFKSFLIFPSRDDFVNTVNHPDRTWKLATSLGITTYKLESDNFTEEEYNNILDTSYQPTHLFDLSRFDDWLENYANTVSLAMKGRAAISFCPKSNL